jgi:hypothetical protein
VRASQVTPSQAQASPLVILAPHHEADVSVCLEHDRSSVFWCSMEERAHSRYVFVSSVGLG